MKNLLKIAILNFTLLFATTTKAQVYYDDKTEEEYKITPQTNKRIVNSFLKEQKATAIEFNPNTSPDFPFRLKNKKGNWALFHSGYESLFMEKESKKYSFQFPTSVMEQRGFTVANRKGKTYLVNLYNEEVETKIGFDEVNSRVVIDTILITNLDSELEEKYTKRLTSFTAKMNNKWGLVEFANGDIYLSRNFLYNSPEEVPAATGFQSYQLEMMENLRKEYKLDVLEALDENGYLFKGRNKKTKLFGIFGGEGTGQTYIASKYNKITPHGINKVFETWENGKVGYYNGSYNLVFEPIFDDFKFVHLDYTYGCAIKTNGTWRLYDTFEPKKLVEGSAATVDGLIDLWLDR